jgi:glucose/arabinose dehydrogenase
LHTTEANIRRRGRAARRLALAVALALAGLIALAALAAAGFAGAPASDAAGTPVAADGAPVSVVATGVQTTTSFAFDGSTMFAGEGPAEPTGSPGGGLFVIANGEGTELPYSPRYVYGLAWHDHALYVSTGPRIIALTGWDGIAFARKRLVYAGRPPFNGFGGIAFGPDGRLYAGLLLKEPEYDHAKDPYWLSQGVVSMTTRGSQLRFVAHGLRQPFQLHFPHGSRYPYVSVLGADIGTAPPDEVVRAKPGQNYGFPTCTWAVLTGCAHFNRPLILLPPHASPMGISSAGRELYVALYQGLPNAGPEVVTIPLHGGTPKPFVTGFSGSIIALAIHRRAVYIGQQDGTIWSVPVP